MDQTAQSVHVNCTETAVSFALGTEILRLNLKKRNFCYYWALHPSLRGIYVQNDAESGFGALSKTVTQTYFNIGNAPKASAPFLWDPASGYWKSNTTVNFIAPLNAAFWSFAPG